MMIHNLRKNPKDLPTTDDQVLVVVNGRYKNCVYQDAVMLALYFDDEGWVIDGAEESRLEVRAWQEIDILYQLREEMGE